MLNVIQLLKKYKIRPKKNLGQNFLIEKKLIEKIVRKLAPSGENKVLEIGSGMGVMTKVIAEKSKLVVAVESDKEMINILENELGKVSNVHLVHEDILDADLEKLLGGKGKWLFIGNIPYNITSPILFHLKKFRNKFERGLLMMQREVADRIVSKPGSKEYGILGIAMQSVAEVKKLFTISSKVFIPEPDVESALVSIEFNKNDRYQIENEAFFMRTVKAAFSTRRKTIRNALLQSHLIENDTEQIDRALEEASIDPKIRAERVEIEKYALLSRLLRNL